MRLPYIPPDIAAIKWAELEQSPPVVVQRMPATPKPPKPRKTRTRFAVNTTFRVSHKTPRVPRPRVAPSPEVLAARRQRSNEAAKRSRLKWLASATPEEVEANRLAIIARVVARQQHLKEADPVAWAAKVKEKNRQYRINKLAKMTPDELHAFRRWESDKAKARYHRKKRVMTPEELQAKDIARKERRRINNTEWIRRKRAAMSPQQRGQWQKEEARKARERYRKKIIASVLFYRCSRQ